MNKENLPVIILRGTVLLPYNEFRIELKKECDVFTSKEQTILIVNQINLLEENIKIEELPKYGILGKIKDKLELPNNNVRINILGLERVQVIDYIDINNSLKANIEYLNKEQIQDETIYIDKLKKEIENYIKILPYASNSIMARINNVSSLDELTDIIAFYLDLKIEQKNLYLIETNPLNRLKMLLKDLKTEILKYEIESNLDNEVKEEINKFQKEYFLKEKLQLIKKELKEDTLKEEKIEKLNLQLKKLNAPEHIKNKIEKEIKRYENLMVSSPEVDIVENYIDWLINLPWNNYSNDNDNLEDVRTKLDKTHSGLEEVKDRIIEYLAVKKLTNNLRGPIICLVGPPGVGKTSLALSIAQSMNREFAKISVGGISDEAELIGHRKTYIGSSPGRIISSLRKTKTSNPVILIDEIDKMLKNYKGDPASVLLNILDPEQNKYFSDNYIEEQYDLSKIMFVATANSLDNIPLALRDRLEIVNLSGYTEKEKILIARNYLLPKICKEHGLNVNGLIIKDEILLKIINNYTKEAGVRELKRLLETIIRKLVTRLARTRIAINKFNIDNKCLKEFLGNEKYIDYPKIKNEIGVVNGLAYTIYGGDILKIEVNYFKGTGKLILTGSLGDVIKESSLIALDYIKANYKEFKIDYELLTNSDIHIHFPEGATPKDGPSAGISITTAIISAFTNFKIPTNYAFTGEITLHGSILPIGGLKEKTLGAYRNNINKIIIPDYNKKDLDKIDDEIKEKIEFITVKNYKEIYKILKKEGNKNE